MTERELELAELLMDWLCTIDTKELRDEYGEALQQLAEAVIAGRQLEPIAEPEGAPANLMEILEASVRAAQTDREPPSGSG